MEEATATALDRVYREDGRDGVITVFRDAFQKIAAKGGFPLSEDKVELLALGAADGFLKGR